MVKARLICNLPVYFLRFHISTANYWIIPCIKELDDKSIVVMPDMVRAVPQACLSEPKTLSSQEFSDKKRDFSDVIK